jgi:hypothetical protein
MFRQGELGNLRRIYIPSANERKNFRARALREQSRVERVMLSQQGREARLFAIAKII